MSEIDYAAWKIHNQNGNHADYLNDLARGWQIFQNAFKVDDYPIERQREMFTEWHLHNLREPSFVIRN